MRECWATSAIGWLEQKREWVGLQTIAFIKSTVFRNGRMSVATRCYIYSLPPDAKRILYAARNHWSIENNLHWQLDTNFDDDKSTVRKVNGPVNMSVVKCFGLSILYKTPINRGLQRKRNMLAATQSGALKTLIS